MSGITDLQTLLRNMNPVLHEGEFVFVSFGDKNLSNFAALDPVCIFQEDEGTTFILGRKKADENFLRYDSVFRMITLTVHSSLEAVGFLAEILNRLSNNGISVNPVSGFYHDHLFVPINKAEQAMKLLENVSSSE